MTTDGFIFGLDQPSLRMLEEDWRARFADLHSPQEFGGLKRDERLTICIFLNCWIGAGMPYGDRPDPAAEFSYPIPIGPFLNLDGSVAGRGLATPTWFDCQSIRPILEAIHERNGWPWPEPPTRPIEQVQ